MGILCLCREGLNMIKFVASACLVAAALADADPYYGAYGYGGYGLGYAAAVPFGSSTGLDPITQGLVASTQGYAPYAYGHYGYGHHGLIYGKRSADAEADPYYGFGYAAVPFGSSTGLDPITQGLDASTQGYAPFAHYGYGHHGLIYGKRSADADAYYGLI